MLIVELLILIKPSNALNKSWIQLISKTILKL